MIILKLTLFYVGMLCLSIPVIVSFFSANDSKDLPPKPEFPYKGYRTIFIIGVIILTVAVSLCILK